MFKSKGLFSEVPCPHLESCVLPNCLFSHASSSPQPSSQAPGSLNGVSVKAAGPLDKTAVNDQDEPKKKRRRLDFEKTTPDSVAKPLAPPKPQLSQSSSRKPVSPPPLKRNVDKLANINLSKAAGASGIAVNKINASAVASPVKSKAVKVEQLNPRMIKTAPAAHDMRFRLLKMLHEQLIRLNTELATVPNAEAQILVLSDQQLISMALDIEELAAVGKPTVYANIVKNKIMLYKRMKVDTWRAERAEEKAKAEATSKSKHGLAKPTIAMPATEKSLPIETGLNTEQEIDFIIDFLLTPFEGLSKHGYVTSVPTEHEVQQAIAGLDAAKGWEVCDRCKARFQVFPGRRADDGALTSGGSCLHHWGKPYTPEKDPSNPKGKRQRRYRCCNEQVGDSTGCVIGKCHVFKISEVKRLASILQFEETPYTAMFNAEQPPLGPICIDGEMGYTVYGLELVRLTATSWPSGDELLDVLVRPIGEILDLNSRFSGVWPEQFSTATTYQTHETREQKNPAASAGHINADISQPAALQIVSSPAAARSLLYKYITPSTPIIGHGLENDLNALRLVHPTIIDTVFLYPHQAGLPYRNGLKNLMWQHLKRKIQVANSTATGSEDGTPATGGHDSKEDARAAGELVRQKIKTKWDDMKREGWKLDSDGRMVEPEQKAGGLTVAQLEGEDQNSSLKRVANQISD